MGGRTSSMRYYQHSSRDHMTTQAPSLHQSRDTFGGRMFLIISPNVISILLGWDGLGLVSYLLVIYY